MKRFFFFFLALASLAIVMDSCMTEAQSTPEFFARSKLFRTNGPSGRDTINMTDSLHIGDTLLWPVAYYTRFNYLTRATVSVDEDAFSYWFRPDSDLLAVLTEASKPEEGVLCFKEGCTAIPAMFCFVPKKSGVYRFTFMVFNSSTKEGFSPQAFPYDIVVSDSSIPEPQSTPELYASILYRINGPSGRDTLHLTDSLRVGDSLLCPMTLLTRYNYLTFATATADQDAFSYWFSCDSDVVTILTEASKPEEGVLFFKEGYSTIPVTFCFVPKKSGTNRVTFVVANTAKEDFSPRTFYFDAVVK